MKEVDLSKLKGLGLETYDYKIVIDRSGSMRSQGTNGTRWEDAHDISKEISNICDKYDDDGIDIILFDSEIIVKNNVHANDVDNIFRSFQPRGTTDTAAALATAIHDFLPKKIVGGLFKKSKIITPDLTNVKPLIVVVLTDGQPNNTHAVESVIIEATKSISSRKQLGITFLQVGNDAGATRFLKSLDDDLETKGAKFDIVDTKNYTEVRNMNAIDILVGALTD